jgi:catechol 2,3-dioxygenase-like lactoylglutathione lyase family enzyme
VATALFESLDYLYLSAPEIEAAIAFYTDALGGELLWRVRDGETWVAAVRVVAEGPGRVSCFAIRASSGSRPTSAHGRAWSATSWGASTSRERAARRLRPGLVLEEKGAPRGNHGRVRRRRRATASTSPPVSASSTWPGSGATRKPT